MVRRNASRTARSTHRAVLTALGVTLFAVSGCFESSTEVASLETATSDNLVPTMEQIRAQVSMSDAQAEELQVPLDGWESAERAFSTARPEQLLPPALEFVESAADVLERRQLTALVDVVVDHQARRLDGPPRVSGHHGRRGGFGGPHRGGGPRDGGGLRDGLGPFADLDLSEAQRQALREAREAMGQTIRALREQVQNGELTREQFREAAAGAREQFHAAVQEILTPEQQALLQEKMKQRLIARLEWQVERHEQQSARRLELLTKILGLDEAQVQTIGAIHDDAGAQLAALLAGLKDDTLTAAEARAALGDLRKSTRNAIVSALNPEQVELFEQLLQLHRRGRRHGPRG